MSIWSVTQLEVESRRSTITIKNHLHFFEYFDEKIIYMKFSFRFWKGFIYPLIFWVFFLHKIQKDLSEKRSCLQVFSAILSLESSSFPDLLSHKMLQALWQSIAFDRAVAKTAEENAIKLHVSPNSRIIFTSSEYHELLELDLRMLLYFFSENLISDPFSPHCAIMRFFRWLCDRMRQEVNCAKSHQRTISEALYNGDPPT